VRDKTLLPLLQTVKLTLGRQFLVQVAIGRLQEQDKLIDVLDVAVHQRVNKRSGIAFEARVGVDKLCLFIRVLIGIATKLIAKLREE
jgi:hypothetical protein